MIGMIVIIIINNITCTRAFILLKAFFSYCLIGLSSPIWGMFRKMKGLGEATRLALCSACPDTFVESGHTIQRDY